VHWPDALHVWSPVQADVSEAVHCTQAPRPLQMWPLLSEHGASIAAAVWPHTLPVQVGSSQRVVLVGQSPAATHATQ
jgi:hypothetical protein